jgi:hypothetical protein
LSDSSELASSGRAVGFVVATAMRRVGHEAAAGDNGDCRHRMTTIGNVAVRP